MRHWAVPWLLVAALAVGLAGCGGEQEQTEANEAAEGYPEKGQAEPPKAELKNIVDTAVGAGDFGTLAKALTAAGLVETLKGDGPFTVFAPTDAAFAKLPEGQLTTLLMPQNKGNLQGVLKYHVVSGKLMAAEVMKRDSLTTLQGGELTVETQDGTCKVDGATVVQADVECSNGVIHVVDAVMIP